MANVLDSEKQQQILALGRLGWTLRRIEQETGVRRETASHYLKQAGIEVRPPGRWGHPDSKPAIEVFTDPAALERPPPGAEADVPVPTPGRSPTVSACEPHREWIEVAVRDGRDAMSIWQDLVDDWGFTHSYQSVRRFVVKLRGESILEAHPIIQTAPGEDYGKTAVM